MSFRLQAPTSPFSSTEIQEREAGFEWRTHIPPEGQFLTRCERFREVVEAVEHWFEHLAVQWCPDYYFSFHEHASVTYPWVLTTSERLLTRKEKELDRIVRALGGEVVDAYARPVRTALRVCLPDPPVGTDPTAAGKGENLAVGDSNHLDPKGVSAFDLDFYSESLEPDYGRAVDFQSKQVPRFSFSSY